MNKHLERSMGVNHPGGCRETISGKEKGKCSFSGCALDGVMGVRE